MDSSIQTDEYYTKYTPNLPSLKKPYHILSVVDFSIDTKRVYPFRNFVATLSPSPHRSSNYRKKFHRRLGSADPVLPTLKNSPGLGEARRSAINLERLSVLLALYSPKHTMK